MLPGLRSSRIYIVDTEPDPGRPHIVKTIEPEELAAKTGYSRPHTVHCGPEGIYVSTLGGAGPDGTAGPPGIFIMDCETFEVLGRWEIVLPGEEPPEGRDLLTEATLPPEERGRLEVAGLGRQAGVRVHLEHERLAALADAEVGAGVAHGVDARSALGRRDRGDGVAEALFFDLR